MHIYLNIYKYAYAYNTAHKHTHAHKVGGNIYVYMYNLGVFVLAWYKLAVQKCESWKYVFIFFYVI